MGRCRLQLAAGKLSAEAYNVPTMTDAHAGIEQLDGIRFIKNKRFPGNNKGLLKGSRQHRRAEKATEVL